MRFLARLLALLGISSITVFSFTLFSNEGDFNLFKVDFSYHEAEPAQASPEPAPPAVARPTPLPAKDALHASGSADCSQVSKQECKELAEMEALANLSEQNRVEVEEQKTVRNGKLDKTITVRSQAVISGAQLEHGSDNGMEQTALVSAQRVE